MRYRSLRARLDPHLPLVEKPGRYVGLERNVVRKDLTRASATLALAFPDTYEIGMSHTGLKILYELVNRRPDLACERVYAPWVDLEARMRENGIPLFSVESFAAAADFDVLGFSLQAELNYSNILNMLDLAGIPVWQRDRPRRRPLHGELRADRRLLRRVPDRRRGGGARPPARCRPRGAGGGPPAAGAARPPRRARGRLRAVAL
jgi:radical SAM family protein